MQPEKESDPDPQPTGCQSDADCTLGRCDVVSGDCVNGHPCRLDNRPSVVVKAGRVLLEQHTS